MHREQTIKDREYSLSQLQNQFDSNIYIIKRNIERYCNEQNVKNYTRDMSTYNRLIATDLLNQYFSSFDAVGIKVSGYYPKDKYILQDKLLYDKGNWLEKHGFREYTYGLEGDDAGYSAYKIIQNDEGITILWDPKNMRDMLFFITFTNEYLKFDSQSEQLSGFIRSNDSDIRLFGEYNAEIPSTPDKDHNYKSGKYCYLYQPSEEFAKMQYIYVLKEPLFNAMDIAAIVGIIVIVVVLSVLLSYASTVFIYRPFGDTLKLLGKDDTNNDELDYLLSSSADMKIDNQRLQKRLNESGLLLKDKKLGEFVMGMMSLSDMQEMVHKFGMDYFVENGCTIAVVQIDEFNNDRDLSISEESETYLKILNYLKAIQNKNKTFELFGQGFRGIVFLFASDNINQIKNKINHIILDLSDKFNVLSTGTVGTYSNNFYEVYNSYREAIKIFETSAYEFFDRNVVAFEDIKDVAGTTAYNYPMETERQLIRCISDGKYDQAMQLLKTVLDCNLQEQNLLKSECIEFKFAIAATIKRVLQCIGKTTEEVFGEGSIIYLELSMCKNNAALYDKIWDMFETTVNILKTENVKDDEKLIVKIIKYINNNYQKDLSLQDISEKFDVSTFYISRLFRLKKDTTFKEYINSLRVEKAKHIMTEEPNITVHELAQRVGYNRSETFYRVFKNIEGDTPKGYLSRINNKK